MTGCTVWIEAAIPWWIDNRSSTASWNIRIPYGASVAGFDLYLQAAALVPGWNPGNFVTSNAAHARIGTP